MKKISVIIAAYNAEEYLSETMDSIFYRQWIIPNMKLS